MSKRAITLFISRYSIFKPKISAFVCDHCQNLSGFRMFEEMMQAIEATGIIDVNGHLSLDQPIQAHPGGVRVTVLLAEPASQTFEEGKPNTTEQKSPSPGTRPVWERIADISAQMPDEEWAKLPKDLSKNVDHYLYGLPKESE